MMDYRLSEEMKLLQDMAYKFAKNEVAPYSNYGDWINVTAPGGNVDNGSLVVHFGRIMVAAGENLLILQPDTENIYSTDYWQSLHGSDQFVSNKGRVFSVNGQGLSTIPEPGFVVTGCFSGCG